MIEFFLFIFLGAMTGLLAGMFGIGGGSLMVPALIFIFHQMGFVDEIIVHMAIGTSLASILFSALSSSYTHHKKQSVEWTIALLLSAGMLVGAFMGAKYANDLNNEQLMLIIVVFLVLVGSDMLFGYSARWISAEQKKLPSIPPLLTPIHGSWIGFLSSILGIGGGSFTAPLLTAHGYSIHKGIGTAAACGIPIACSGAIGYMYFGYLNPSLPTNTTGFVFWPAVIGIGLSSVLTARMGANITHSISPDLLKKMFGAFLLLVAFLVRLN